MQMQQQMQMNMGMPYGMNSPNAPMPQQFMMERECLLEPGHLGAGRYRLPMGSTTSGLSGLGRDPPPFPGFRQCGRGLRRAAANRIETSARRGAADRATGSQGALRGQLHGRGGRVPAQPGEGRGRQRSRGPEPAGPPLPGLARPRQEVRLPRAGVEGHPGCPGGRQGRLAPRRTRPSAAPSS